SMALPSCQYGEQVGQLKRQRVQDLRKSLESRSGSAGVKLGLFRGCILGRFHLTPCPPLPRGRGGTQREVRLARLGRSVRLVRPSAAFRPPVRRFSSAPSPYGVTKCSPSLRFCNSR